MKTLHIIPLSEVERDRHNRYVVAACASADAFSHAIDHTRDDGGVVDTGIAETARAKEMAEIVAPSPVLGKIPEYCGQGCG